MTRVLIKWRPEELAWIEANRGLPRAALHAAFCDRFGRADVSFAALDSLCKRNAWRNGRVNRFVKGQVAPNKGRKMGFNAASAAAGFQKGNVPLNTKYAGHERVGKDGYTLISVEETDPHSGSLRRYVQKHRWLWVQVNGPVPEGMRLKCLDGDKTNCDPSNWEAIPIALAPRLNGRFGRGYDAAPTELKPLIMAATKLEHAAREARRGKKP